jgi:hypothetical protein
MGPFERREKQISAHVFIGSKLVARPIFHFAPRKGETLRLTEKLFVKVTEVIWCLDEPDNFMGQRVNLRTVKITYKAAK